MFGAGGGTSSYEETRAADLIVLWGSNAREAHPIFFHHVLKAIHNGAKLYVVDPRRTVTVNACEIEAGKTNVLHLAINSGTDLALFNALVTEVNERGWIDKEFIAASISGFDAMLAANKTSIEDAAKLLKRLRADLAGLEAEEFLALWEGADGSL